MKKVVFDSQVDGFPWGAIFVRCEDGKDVVRFLSGPDSIIETVDSLAAEYPGCIMRIFEDAGNAKKKYFQDHVENFWGSR